MQDHQLERLARKRASAKLGWYTHAFIYIVVNLGLASLSALSGRHWAIFPALGWGVGLAVHAFLVFAPVSGVMERLVERERQQLQRDPW